MCLKSNVVIKPLSKKELNNISNNNYNSNLIKSKNSINEQLNPKSTNVTNLKKEKKKKKLNEYSIIDRDSLNNCNSNINNNLEDAKDYNEEEEKLNSSYKIIELISMERSSHKTENISKHLIKTYVPSSFRLTKFHDNIGVINEKKLYTVNPHNNFHSFDLNQTTINNKGKEKINIIFFSDFKEKMTEIWFNEGDEVKFMIKNNIKWGIREKGLCDYKGYNVIFNKNNLCCLLMRIGDDKKYTSIDCNEVYYARKKGPLFLKMNIEQNYLMINNYHLEGMLQVEIINGEKLNPFQIFSRCGFEGNIHDFEKNEIVYTINLLRKFPQKFYNIFFTEFNINDFINVKKICKESLIISDKLQNISKLFLENNFKEITENEINIIKNNINNQDSYFENMLQKFFIEKVNNSIKENIFELDNLVPLDIIKKLCEENEYLKYIMDKDFKYIGVSFKEEDNSHISKDYFKCSIIISKTFF